MPWVWLGCRQFPKSQIGPHQAPNRDAALDNTPNEHKFSAGDASYLLLLGFLALGYVEEDWSSTHQHVNIDQNREFIASTTILKPLDHSR